MPELTLDHVVIAVRDLTTATADYADLLGRQPSWRGEHPAYGTANTLFRIENTYIELIAPSGQKAKDKRFLEPLQKFVERGEGVFMLALGTSDLKTTVRELRDHGIEIGNPADGEGVDIITGARRAWRNALASPKTTNGVQLLFIEHKSPRSALPVAEMVAPESCVTRMDHAVLLSPDLEATRRVWMESLGVRLALDRTFPDRNTRILFFRLGDITIEASGGAEQSAEGMGKPDRIWGLAWGVPDVEAACERLREAGIDVAGPRPGIKPGTLVATVKGPQTHGVATLLIEHQEESFREESRLPHSGAFDNAPQRRAFTATGLDHVMLGVADVDAAAATWRDTLGLDIANTLAPAGQPLRLIRIGAGNAAIDLAQPLDESTPFSYELAQRGPGMFSIGIDVDDLDAAVRDLRAKRVDVGDPHDGWWPETRVARINRANTHGVAIYLVGR